MKKILLVFSFFVLSVATCNAAYDCVYYETSLENLNDSVSSYYSDYLSASENSVEKEDALVKYNNLLEVHIPLANSNYYICIYSKILYELDNGDYTYYSSDDFIEMLEEYNLVKTNSETSLEADTLRLEVLKAIYSEISELSVKEGKRDRAIEYALKIVDDIDYRDANAYYLLAQMYFSRSMVEDARDAIDYAELYINDDYTDELKIDIENLSKNIGDYEARNPQVFEEENNFDDTLIEEKEKLKEMNDLAIGAFSVIKEEVSRYRDTEKLTIYNGLYAKLTRLEKAYEGEKKLIIQALIDLCELEINKLKLSGKK